jgi:hypothetical protein
VLLIPAYAARPGIYLIIRSSKYQNNKKAGNNKYRLLFKDKRL